MRRSLVRMESRSRAFLAGATIPIANDNRYELFWKNRAGNSLLKFHSMPVSVFRLLAESYIWNCKVALFQKFYVRSAFLSLLSFLLISIVTIFLPFLFFFLRSFSLLPVSFVSSIFFSFYLLASFVHSFAVYEPRSEKIKNNCRKPVLIKHSNIF